MTSPTCNTCAYLIGNREYQEKWQTWKCGAPRNIKSQKINLVSGLEETVYAIELCYLNREASLHCGQEGKWYEEYMPPVRISEPTIGGKTVIPTEIVFDDTAQQANREAASKRIEELKKRKTGSLSDIKAEEL